MEDMRDVQKKLKWQTNRIGEHTSGVEVKHREVTVFWVSFKAWHPVAKNSDQFARLLVDFSEGQDYELRFDTIADAKAGANAELKTIALEILSRVLPGR